MDGCIASCCVSLLALRTVVMHSELMELEEANRQEKLRRKAEYATLPLCMFFYACMHVCANVCLAAVVLIPVCV